jgi:hypothetical protein
MQLVLALHNYEMTHEVLPPGSVNPDGPIRSEAKGYHMSWLVQLQPQLGRQTLRNAVDFNVGVYAAANAKPLHTAQPGLRCPSSSDAYGQSSYAGCHHDEESPIAADNHGVLFLNSSIREEDLTDGRAYTLFLGERLPESGDLGWASGTRATLRNPGTGINAELLAEFATHVTMAGASRSEAGALAPVEGAEQKPAVPEVPPVGRGPLSVGGFGSQHTGGAQFALGDGSIRFLNENIDRQLLQKLAHRNDGELVGEF